MLSKCVNPACPTPFRYFREGRILNLETIPSANADAPRRREFFWLCGPCSATMKVTLRNGAPFVEQRYLQLVSGELIEQANEEHPYMADTI